MARTNASVRRSHSHPMESYREPSSESTIRSISPRLLALAAGEYHGRMLRQGISRYHRANGDTKLRMYLLLEDLAHSNAICPDETRKLSRLVEYITEIDRSGSRRELALQDIRRIANELCDADAHPLSIALSTIAYDSAKSAMRFFEAFPQAATADGPATSDVEGGFLGAGAGLVGGLAGVLLGGIYGSAIGTFAWALDNQHKNKSTGAWFRKTRSVESAAGTSHAEVARLRMDETEPAALRHVALAAGELHGSLYRVVLNRGIDAGFDGFTFASLMLDDMSGTRLIDGNDVVQLKRINELLNSAAVRKSNHSQMLIVGREVRRIYERLVDSNGSPVAVAIAGVATNSVDAINDNLNDMFGSQSEAKGGVATNDFYGAVGGGGIGGQVGGLYGAIAGVIIGGGAYSLATWIDNQNPSVS